MRSQHFFSPEHVVLKNATLPLGAPFRFWLFQAKQETLSISFSINSEASKTKIVSSDPLRLQREVWEEIVTYLPPSHSFCFLCGAQELLLTLK